jgi:hypothetical protein
MLPSFPLLVPEDESLRRFHGYIVVSEREYRLRVHQSPTPLYAPTTTMTAATTKMTTTAATAAAAAAAAAARKGAAHVYAGSNQLTTQLWCDDALAALLRGYESVLQVS